MATLTILTTFNGTNGQQPDGRLIADGAGDLLGTTSEGGANGYGTVFEITKTGSSYSSTPTTLASFNGADGDAPFAGLIADAGDLFGTTANGGSGFGTPAFPAGTVFEIAKNSGGYTSTPTALVTFSADGRFPEGNLIADATGDLFGTTYEGGLTDTHTGNGSGTVFEIPYIDGRLRQHAHHTGPFQRYRRRYGGKPARRPDRRRGWGPLRDDTERGGERQRHGL